MVNHFKKNHFLFWQQWLFYTSLLFAFSGIAFAVSGKSILFQPYNQMLAEVFWHNNQFPRIVEPFRDFMYGPFGGTIACCYILVAFIAKYAFKQKQKWARNAIIAAFSVWVILDSLSCIYFGVYPQVYLINAFSILMKALPLIFTWKDFRVN